MTSNGDRIPFLQSEEWERRQRKLSICVYSADRCCYCFRPVKPDAPKLRLTRDDGGEWYVVTPPNRSMLDDERTFEHFTLPIGRDCLAQHPEFRGGLIP